MKSPRSLGWLRCGAGFLVGSAVAWSVIAADAPKPATSAPTTPLSGLVEKFTEKHTSLPAAHSAARPVEQPAAPAVNPEHAATKTPPRKPSPPLASLPAPKAASGPLRILIVDDDWDNNSPGATPKLTASDEIFRTLVAAAVGGDAAAWSVAIAERYKDGPGIERLRDYNVVLWYTGASHGADPSGVSTLSREDEKTVRRYLQEIGGSFILVSPGYANNLSYATSWTDSPHPFLKEVVGVNGLAGFVQRGSGTVQAHDGSSFTVQEKGAAEALFSAVNPDGAAVVFTSKLDPKKTAAEPVPVAVAHPFGGGRFVYVGFTFENIPAADRAKAFDLLLHAAVGSKPPVARIAKKPTKFIAEPTAQTITEIPPAPPGPPPTQLRITYASAPQHNVAWVAPDADSFEIFRRDPDGWRFLRGGESFIEQHYWDYSFVAPNSAYKVVAVYADGRRGEAILEYPNPPQPQRPTGLKIVQTGPGTVQLDWVNVPGEAAYVVSGRGVPSSGLRITILPYENPGPTGRATVNFLPNGIHEFQVATAYGPFVAPVYASASVAVNSDHGSYRMVFLGVKVVEPAADDGDGLGNEIFAGAFWATTSQAAAPPAVGGGFAHTLVYGDTQGFPDRIRAGTAGPMGGLRAGDYAPSGAEVTFQPSVTALTDRFPLKLWEGELSDTGPIVGVIPIVFEWSSPDHNAWSFWANYWSSPYTVDTSFSNADTKQSLGDAMRSNLSAPLASQALYRTKGPDHIPSVCKFDIRPGHDRAIGLFPLPPYTPDPHYYGYKPSGFALTRQRVETALAGQSIKNFEITWTDEYPLKGKYTGYFQLERLSEAPFVAPPPAPVYTVTPIVPIVMGTAVPTPPPPLTPTVTELPPGNRNAGNQTIRPVEAPSPGPPPTELSVSSDNPERHLVRWRSPGGAVIFNVFRKQGDQWITLPSGTTSTQALDESFVARGTVYQVVAHYADGREGKAEVTFANPAQPLVVRELTGTQTGEGKMKLAWKMTADTGVSGQRVYAPGLPAGGQLLPLKTGEDQTFEISNLAEGGNHFRVALQYGDKVAPIDADLTATVATWSGQYRFVLLGFRVVRQTTDDDILDGDGKGDEVFFGAYRVMVAADGVTKTELGVVQSAVMGDTNGFASRVRAGTASPTGGLRSGDVFPSDAAVVLQPGIVATTDRLPLLLWDGRLANDSGKIIVALTAFEWDNASSSTWDLWKNSWSLPSGVRGIRAAASDPLAISRNVIHYVPLAETYLVDDPLAPPPPSGGAKPKVERYLGFTIEGRPIVTRPIGAQKDTIPSRWYCVPYGVMLTRNNIERTLGTRSAAIFSTSLSTRSGPSSSNPAEQDEAEYIVYLQIERVSAAPVTGP